MFNINYFLFNNTLCIYRVKDSKFRRVPYTDIYNPYSKVTELKIEI